MKEGKILKFRFDDSVDRPKPKPVVEKMEVVSERGRGFGRATFEQKKIAIQRAFMGLDIDLFFRMESTLPRFTGKVSQDQLSAVRHDIEMVPAAQLIVAVNRSDEQLWKAEPSRFSVIVQEIYRRAHERGWQQEGTGANS